MGIQKFSRAIAALTVVGAVTASLSFTAYAATLTSSSLRLSDSRVGQTSQYTLSANGFSTGTNIGCIEIDLGTAADGTGAVAGLATGSSTFVSQTITATGTWAADNAASADHKLRLTNATPVAPQAGAQTAVWGAVTNGSTANTSYFAVFRTFTTNACSVAVDTVVVQIVFTDGQATSVSVDPTLSFSVAGVTGDGTITVNGAVITNTLATTSSTIPFGTATSASNRIAAQDLTVTTNAGSGYTVSTRYTGALTSGSYTITDHTGSNATPTAFSAAGTESFGYTTNDATLGTGTVDRFTSAGGNKWAAFTSSDAEIAYNSAAASSQTTRVGFQVGVAGTTEPGTYNTTVIYTATPVY